MVCLLQRAFPSACARTFKDSRHQLGELNAQVEDSLSGIRVVKSFANEELEKEKFAEGNRRLSATSSAACTATWRASIRSRGCLTALMYIVVVVLGALFMIHGDRSPPRTCIAYLLYVTDAADLHPPHRGVHPSSSSAA